MILTAKGESKRCAKEEIWYLDSGCNNHMIGVKIWFFQFDGSFKETMKLGDNSKMYVMGKGNMELSIGSKTYLILVYINYLT